ncbi:DnaJ domain-containing protein [Trichoderma velutinum]
MAPSEIIDDYYQILDVPQSAGRDAIRTNYKKLAFKYHPDRNSYNPQATAQFQRLEAAYSTLFNPERRRVYDLQYVFIKLQYLTSPDTERNYPPSPTSTQESEASKHYEPWIEQAGAALEELRKQMEALENELHNAQRECYNSQSALNKLCADNFRDFDMQYQIDRSGWFGSFFSTRETKEEKLARQRRMDNYEADLRVRCAELERHRNRVKAANSSLNALNEHIKNRTFEKRMLQREATRMAEIQRREAG